MSRRSRHRASRSAARRRVAALVAIAALSTAAGLAVGASDSNRRGTRIQAAPAVVVVTQDGRTLLRAGASRLAASPRERIRRWLERVPDGREVRRGRATFERATERDALVARVAAAARRGGGTVPVPERTVAAEVRLGVVKQALRNNCETAALSMLLASRGVRAAQLSLQRALPRSGPADPVTKGAVPLWGDPNRGFVGRVEGGGTNGGYGVYEPPIIELARTRGEQLTRLSGDKRVVYRSLLSGRPVMVWVGLSDGPFMTWLTPTGHRITGNFGEHTVVLTGIAGNKLAVNDPLSGTRLNWSRAYFEQLWARLGRRAVA